MDRPRMSPQKKKILDLLVMAGADGMTIADIIEAVGGKKKYIVRILSGLAMFGMVDCDDSKTYRARKTSDGRVIERFPKGTKIEYRNGVRVVLLPPRPAYSYGDERAQLSSNNIFKL